VLYSLLAILLLGQRLPRRAPELPEAMKVLWQDAISNIQFLKSQQWHVSNYTMLLYAAIVAVERGIPIKSQLNGFVWLLGCAGVIMIWRLQFQMDRHRKRIRHMYDTYFSVRERINPDLSLNLRAKGWLFPARRVDSANGGFICHRIRAVGPIELASDL
jgi:hypothetical protein